MASFPTAIENFIHKYDIWIIIFLVFVVIGLIVWASHESFNLVADGSSYGSVTWDPLCDPFTQDCTNKPNWGNADPSTRQYTYGVFTVSGKPLQSGSVEWNNANPGFTLNPSQPFQPNQQFKVIVNSVTSIGTNNSTQTFTYKSPTPVVSSINLMDADSKNMTNFDYANSTASLSIAFQPGNYGSITGSTGGFYIGGKQMSGQNFTCGSDIQDDKLSCRFNVSADNMYGGTKYVPWVNITTAAGPTGVQKSSITYTQSSTLPGVPAGLSYTAPKPGY